MDRITPFFHREILVYGEMGFLLKNSLRERTSTKQKEGLKWQRNLQRFT